MIATCLKSQGWVACVCVCLACGINSQDRYTVAQEANLPTVTPPKLSTLDDLAKKPSRWLMVVCGLPGDAEHRERLTRATRQIALSAPQVFGITEGQRVVLAGDEEMVAALSSDLPACQVATRELMEESIATIGSRLKPQDAVWVILLGHANLHGKSSYFNLAERDIDQVGFAELVGQLQCQQKVFWISTPVSGFWLRPLGADNTVSISATEAALELTGTEMPYALGDVLAGESQHQPLADIDQDGRLSLLDLYLAVNVEITARFAALERLQTEHAQLDDDGDGRGWEPQADYLPVDPLDETKRGRRKIVKASIRDGKLANTVLIALPKRPSL